jgi:hypothetical protein
VRAQGIVMLAPGFDDDPRLGEAVEQLPVQQLVAELRVEALAITVLPRTAGLDEGGPGSHRGDPLSHGPGDELRAVVGTHVARRAVQAFAVVVADDGMIRRIIPNGERPGGLKRSDRTSMTSVDFSFRSTRIARRSRVNSSMTLSMRSFLPLWVRSSTKS